MTIETLNAIKAQAEALQESTLDLGGALDAAESSGIILPAEVDTAFADLTTNLYTILEWVDLAIQASEDGGNTGEIGVMQAFLAELKAVFDKYAAVIEYMDGAGYGEDYGVGAGLKITIIDPASGETYDKVFDKTSISSTDLLV